jgi:hypothetical protein
MKQSHAYMCARGGKLAYHLVCLVVFGVLAVASNATASTAAAAADDADAETCAPHSRANGGACLVAGVNPGQFNLSRAGGVVSLSTVPERLANGLLEPTIRTLLQQTLLLPIVVAIPWHSKRFPEKTYEVPEWLRRTAGVHITRCEDWGPATKLIAALDLVSDRDFIITVDDDTLYHPQLVENLVRYAEAVPGAAIAHAGHRLWGPALDLQDFRSVEFVRPPHHARIYGRSVSVPTEADVLHRY